MQKDTWFKNWISDALNVFQKKGKEIRKRPLYIWKCKLNFSFTISISYNMKWISEMSAICKMNFRNVHCISENTEWILKTQLVNQKCEKKFQRIWHEFQNTYIKWISENAKCILPNKVYFRHVADFRKGKMNFRKRKMNFKKVHMHCYQYALFIWNYRKYS